MVTIVNYGMGNLGSIQNMVKKVGAQSEVTSDLNVIAKAKKLILPGVGKFDMAMLNIENFKLKQILNEKTASGTPLLGICLGMQILGDGSDEGSLPGLGLIPGFVKSFDVEDSLKIPHMGWNLIDYKRNKLFNGFEEFEEARFYFVHSFHFVCKNEENSLAKSSYGKIFTSAIHQDNIYGVQFHPEKSHKFGMKLIKNFIEIV